MFSGVSSLGKASYVITLTPYVVLTALLIYAAPREVELKYDENQDIAIAMSSSSRADTDTASVFTGGI